MDSQSQPQQYPSDGPSSASSRHHNHPLHLHQYNHNQQLPFPSPSSYSPPYPLQSGTTSPGVGIPQHWGRTHRSGISISNSRDEVHPQQQQAKRDTQRDSTAMSQPPTKVESAAATNGHGHGHAADDSMPSTSDFVKKLYKMLEDPTFQEVVSWGPAGDCFVVKDMNEFTKSILPRMFKHSNFASFVRQLNKYDFHKVKNTDDNQFGEHSWTFRHPDFHADRRDALENIKRKVPAQRKSTSSASLPSASSSHSASNPVPSSSSLPTSTSPTSMYPPSPNVDLLQAEIRRLKDDGEELRTRLRSLERNYENVLVEMVGFQRGMAQQDGLMQSLIAYFLGSESGKVNSTRPGSQNTNPTTTSTGTPDHNPFLPPQFAQRIIAGAGGADSVGRATLMQMSELSRRAVGLSGSTGAGGGEGGTTSTWNGAASRAETLARIEELHRERVGMGGWASSVAASTSASVAQQQQQRRRSSMPEPMGPPPPPPADTIPGVPSSSSSSYAGWPLSSLPMSSSMSDGSGSGPSEASAHEGLQVYTVGHLMPRDMDPVFSGGKAAGDGSWAFESSGMLGGGAQQQQEGEYRAATPAGGEEEVVRPTPQNSASGNSAPEPASSAVSSQRTLRVRRKTFVPGWAVPPRVLLVDDDAVTRTLSKKFLQVFGCTTDIAVDGVGAVTKMNLEKYDLVLMDIVMPKLDGVAATSLIRKFDQGTPIISMTSNSKPNEIMTYYNHGMNDILPKPFTKEGLLDMLEKHLMHLKVIQQMSRIPRPMSGLSDPNYDQALTVTQNSDTSENNNGWVLNLGLGEGDEGRINPLAAMGLSDESYQTMVQNLISAESFMDVGFGAGGEGLKRALEEDEVGEDGRGGKRSRFEVVE